MQENPNHLKSCYILANQYFKVQQYKAALACYEKVLNEFPTLVPVLKRKALCLRYTGQTDKAIAILETVHIIEPEDQSILIDLSELYLAMGQLQHGWHMYLHRFKTIHSQKTKLDLSSIDGKTILIHREGEIGDNILFIRYAKLLKEHGAYIIAQVHPALVPLFSLCPYLDEVTDDYDENIVSRQYDIMIWQQNLPVAFDTELETVPAPISYITPQAELVAQYRHRIAHDKNFKIGICWQANPSLDLETITATKRSMPLALFEDILRMPGVSVYNLQKRDGLEQCKLLPSDVRLISYDDFDTVHGPFMDTAALISQLDLVITVDTSIAHLAGALGAPTWVVLPFVAEWRWMVERADSPWYPTMRLFRQPEAGDWDSVMRAVYVELGKILKP